jgi:hypothetical protein
MTTLAHLRKAALGLPEVEEGTHFGMVAFAVRDKVFVSVTKEGLVQLPMTDADSEAALAANPAAERLVRMGKPIGIRIPLARVDGQALNHLLRRAWFARAPKRLAAALAEADAAEPGQAAALPAGLGAPATRALLGAGLGRLDQIATRTKAELLSLHGVGPKAVRILEGALHETGRSLRSADDPGPV